MNKLEIIKEWKGDSFYIKVREFSVNFDYNNENVKAQELEFGFYFGYGIWAIGEKIVYVDRYITVKIHGYDKRCQ